MPIEIELDIYSGRKNPVWEMGGDLEAELISRLRALLRAPASAIKPDYPGLGYRGLVVRVSGHPGLEAPVRVYGGSLYCGDRAYPDPGRGLERWLAETAGPALGEKLKKLALKDLEKPGIE